MEAFLWVCQRISFCCWSTAKFVVKYTLFWFISLFISLTKYSVYLHPALGVDQRQISAVFRQYIGMLLIDNVFHSVALHLAYCCRSTHLEIVGTTLARPPFFSQTISPLIPQGIAFGPSDWFYTYGLPSDPFFRPSDHPGRLSDQADRPSYPMD